MKRTSTGLVAALLLLLAAAGPAAAQLKSSDSPEANPTWKKVRATLFAGKPIVAAADDLLILEAPVKADDAAIVPIAIRTRAPQTASRHVDKLYLIIDSNPSPISAIIQFTPQSGRADIETRVRINEYTHVRAVAEMNDGSLHMTSRYVKAAGGCSAPPAKDAREALAALGKMKFRVEGPTPEPDQPMLASLMISHPNDSGFAMDPASKQVTPAHYVRQVNISYAGKPVLSADVDFSISENPNFRFWFVPNGEGELKAEVIDSNELRFEGALKVSQR